MSNKTTPPAADGFVPTQQDIDGVLAYFARYEAHVRDGNVEAMADMALFPINEVTDGAARSCDRDEFVRSMTEMTANSGEISMESHRVPHFLSQNLVFVITDSTITIDGQRHQVRYGDLLVRVDDRWLFQTMVQGGWNE